MIGEIGLDKVKAEQNPKMFCLKSQEDILQVQLELASQYKRPFHLHCVRAWDRILYILEKFRKKTIFISHSHYGNADIIPIMDQMGAYFSYSSVLFKRQKEKVQSCLQKTPIHKILVESDASASIEEIPLLIQKISSVRKEEKDFLVKCIQQNFNEFLNGRSI